MKVIVAGSGGLIGGALVQELRSRGHTVLRLIRSAPTAPDEIRWAPDDGWIDPVQLEGVDALVSFNGVSLGKRWTHELKKQFRTSRIGSTNLLVSALEQVHARPSVFLSASAVGWYGLRGDEELTEASSPGTGFLAELCHEWEQAARRAEPLGVRVVIARSGIVLHREAALLERLVPIFKLGLGGKAGSGDQWISWITLTDHVRAVVHCLEQPAISGPVNITAPNPARNKDLSATLGAVLHRPSAATVPEFALRLALGSEMASETALASQRALPTRLAASGFEFRYPELEPALRHALELPTD